jgi:peroxiredoxin
VNLTSMDEGRNAVQEFVDGYELTFPIPMDIDGDIGGEYRAFTIPTTYMIDTEGQIQHKILGPMNEEMMGEMVAGMD